VSVCWSDVFILDWHSASLCFLSITHSALLQCLASTLRSQSGSYPPHCLPPIGLYSTLYLALYRNPERLGLPSKRFVGGRTRECLYDKIHFLLVFVRLFEGVDVMVRAKHQIGQHSSP
jgi:hypothetical protein